MQTWLWRQSQTTRVHWQQRGTSACWTQPWLVRNAHRLAPCASPASHHADQALPRTTQTTFLYLAARRRNAWPVFQDFVVEELGGDDMGMSKSKLPQLLEQSGKEKKEGHAGHSKSWRSARSHVRVTERCELTLQE